MSRAPALSLPAMLALAQLTSAGSCGDCPQIVEPTPMTEVRAKELDPSLITGVAISTTHVFGDCRPTTPDPEISCPALMMVQCARRREPMRVLIVPVNVSLPRDPACPGGYAVASLAQAAVVNEPSSASGELARSLPAGRYTLYVSSDDRCAACGLVDTGACLLDITFQEITVRDVVLDEATH